MSTTFLATDPTGRVHKRVSQNRTYVATVVVYNGDEIAVATYHAGRAPVYTRR
jgi:hypothetical protein